MKERPILFSAPMVRAILDNKKTMTRRIYKPRFDSWKVGDRLWVRETYTLIHGRADYAATCDIKSYRWRPSIFMPRKYSRILLEITDIKREALRDISEADALREGFENKREFLDYFEKINPEMKGKNPEVAVIGFKIWRNGAMPYAMLYRDESGATSPEWRRFQRQFARPAIAQAILRGKSKLSLKGAAE